MYEKEARLGNDLYETAGRTVPEFLSTINE